MRLKEPIIPNKTCEKCLKPLIQKIKESTHEFNKRKFCGYECSRPRKIKLEGKTCFVCDAPLVQKGHQSIKKYNALKYCSVKCGLIRNKELKRGWFKNSDKEVTELDEEAELLDQRVQAIVKEIKKQEEWHTPFEILKILWPERK